LKSLLISLKTKLDLKDKIESHKNFNKRAKEKKEIKSRRTKSKNIIYTN
jgi:hypothetical protein